MEFWDLADKEFEIAILREPKWTTRKHRKTTQWNEENTWKNEKFNKEIEIIKKDQTNSGAEEFNE